MSTVSLQISGIDGVITKLEQLPARVQVSARSTLDAWAVQLAGYIKASKLSGNPLNRRSGRLSGSVHPVTESTADSVSAGAGGGAGVPYARIHEYGGQINSPGGTAYIYKNGRPAFISNAAAAAMSWLPRTGPHIINMPERSYMRSGFREQAPDGIAQLRAAVKEALVA